MKVKIKNIITILLVLLIILSVCVLVFSRELMVARKTLRYINDEETMEEDVITPGKVYLVIAEYEGKVPIKTIYKAIYNIVEEVFPKYYEDTKDLDEQQLEKYFERNQKLIYIETGIEQKEEFINTMNTLHQLQGETIEFFSYRFDEKTIKKKSNAVNANLYVTYEDNEEIKLKTKIQNKFSKDRTSVIIKAVSE